MPLDGAIPSHPQGVRGGWGGGGGSAACPAAVAQPWAVGVQDQRRRRPCLQHQGEGAGLPVVGMHCSCQCANMHLLPPPTQPQRHTLTNTAGSRPICWLQSAWLQTACHLKLRALTCAVIVPCAAEPQQQAAWRPLRWTRARLHGAAGQAAQKVRRLQLPVPAMPNQPSSFWGAAACAPRPAAASGRPAWTNPRSSWHVMSGAGPPGLVSPTPACWT